MFLTTYVQLIVIGQYIKEIPWLKWASQPGKFLYYPNRNFILCTLATLGIAWEQPNRRVDITYYIIPRTIEILWNMLKNRRLVKADFPFQSPILIAIAFGIIAYKFSEEEELRQKQKKSKKIIEGA